MKLRKGDVIELEIEKMAYGGRGVAHHSGFVVFVRGGVPGDLVEALIYRKKRGYAEAYIAKLLEPSDDRISAPCRYSGYCGGCQWQHIAYDRQLEYKKGHIQETMERIGAQPGVMVHDVIPSERRFAYRNKMEFSFSDRRWFLPHEMNRRQTEGRFALGLHVPGTYHKVIDVDSCLLQQETGNQILMEVKRYARDSEIPVYGLKTHEGFWRFLTVRYSTGFDEWMVNLVTSEERPDIVRPLAEKLCRQFRRIKTVVNSINSRRASIAVGDREMVLAGVGHIKDKIGPFTFRISANSFFQTNSLAAQDLYLKVVEYAELDGNEMVLDLYSGTGTIPIFLAEKVREVVGIEMNESAVHDARLNLEENNISNCRFICGDIRRKLEVSNRIKPDVMIIDPPRAGMHKDVLTRILSIAPAKIIYVSCNPATLARDTGLMAENYNVVEIQPVDMFPHTHHIESVAKLDLKKAG